METIKGQRKLGVFQFALGGVPSTKDTYDLWAMAKNQFPSAGRVVIEAVSAGGSCYAIVVPKPTMDTSGTIDLVMTAGGALGSAISVPNARGLSTPTPSGVFIANSALYAVGAEISPSQGVFVGRDGANTILIVVGVYEN